MLERETFHDLLRRVRAGDQAAATELFRQCEGEVRREIRLRLTDPRLMRLFDSMDLCQSVMGQFFHRAAAGQFQLDTPEQLLKLLLTMARNELKQQARKQRAARRDNRRLEIGRFVDLDLLADSSDTPSAEVAGVELREELRRRLAPDERHLFDQRSAGRDWADIAQEQGGSAEALRKKLTRALQRVAQELRLGEDSQQ